MHILVRSADLLQSSAIFYNHLQSLAIIWIILMIRAVSIIYVLRSTRKALRATLPCGCFLVIYNYSSWYHALLGPSNYLANVMRLRRDQIQIAI